MHAPHALAWVEKAWRLMRGGGFVPCWLWGGRWGCLFDAALSNRATPRHAAGAAKKIRGRKLLSAFNGLYDNVELSRCEGSLLPYLPERVHT